MTNLQQRIVTGLLMAALAVGFTVAGGQFFFMMLALLCLGCLYETAQMNLRSKPLKAAVMVYILLGFVCAYNLRNETGWIFFLVLASMVVLTDVGAYAFGRWIGGPKLAPAISPTKTWAGAIGGIGLTVFVMACVGAYALTTESADFNKNMFNLLLITSAMVSIASQTGDLFESWLKRRAGIKDSSNLIPGHGGIFDRLDSWIGAFLMVGLMMLVKSLL